MTARDRVLQAITTRLDKTQEAERLRRAIEQPTLYDGASRVRPLGAAGAVPVRGVNSTGGLAKGQPVQASQGIISGFPDAINQGEFKLAVARLERLVAEVRNRRGLQVFDGDPNDTANSGANPAFQEFDYQGLYDRVNELLYYWQPSDGVTAGLWEPINISGNTIQYGDGPPTTEFEGTPKAGDRYWDRLVDRPWTYDEGVATWKPDTQKVFGQTPSATIESSLVDRDTIVTGKYSWYWSAALSDWVQNHCCENGPEDPPPANTCQIGDEVFWGTECAFFCRPEWTCDCIIDPQACQA